MLYAMLLMMMWSGQTKECTPYIIPNDVETHCIHFDRCRIEPNYDNPACWKSDGVPIYGNEPNIPTHTCVDDDCTPHTGTLILPRLIQHEPEPFDVPAVVTHDWQQMFGDPVWNDPHLDWKVENNWGYMRTWGCQDARRVLFKAENGERHCILFPQEAK